MTVLIRRSRTAVALVLSVLAFALAAAAQATPGLVVIKPVANMYSSASEDVDVVSQAILGTAVIPLEEKNGWVNVRTPDDYTGWMTLASVRRLSAGEKPYASEGPVAYVTSLAANLYRQPDVTAQAPLLTVPFETRLEITAPADDKARWLQVKLPDGRPAWVQRGDISLQAKPMTIDEMLAHARRFLGINYYWGGTSSFGFDCSGFMQMLVRQRGITMPRDAQPQADWNGVVSVKRDQLQPGDLLYFGRSDKDITHTGMYIGNGEFIHDTTNTRPMVQISRLDDQPWTRLLVACRRIK